MAEDLQLQRSYARRIFFNQVIEAAYVGTQGRDLVSRRQLNAVPLGALLSGTVGGVDLSVPVNRVALDGSVVNTFRPFRSLSGHPGLELRGRLGLQLAAGDPQPADRPAAAVLRRLHLAREPRARRRATASTGSSTRSTRSAPTACCPRIARTSSTCRGTPSCRTAPGAGWTTRSMRGLLNGWQLSGISTLASGVPMFLGFGGQAGSDGVTQAIFGTPDIIGNPGPGGGDRGGLAPIYTCDPRSPAARSARRFSTSTASGSRPSARTATRSRRTTCACRRASTTT